MDVPLFPDDGNTRSITELYNELIGYLDRRWGRAHEVWVTGEVQKFADHRSGHCYLDLIDPASSGRDAPTLKAKCWRTTWSSIRAAVARAGLRIEEGNVLRVRGYVDLYAPRGELSFIITSLDLGALRLAALGEHARRRADVLRRLSAEGLLDANERVAMPELPLRVGLVASRDTEGFNDFFGMLESSGFSFAISLARSAVQGSRAPFELRRAIVALGGHDCDVICLVRGGGSQSDLSAFDDESVARAIAASPVPVMTGVGHTGDVSVADLVASQSHRTPTACAEAIVAMVREWYAVHVADAARRLTDVAASLVDELDDAVQQRRRHVAVVARHRVDRARDRVAHVAAMTTRRATHALDRDQDWVLGRAARLVPAVRHHLTSAEDSVAARRTLLDAYDPARLLARGWSITTDGDGRVVRSIEDLDVGHAIATRLADGVARSTVTELQGSG
jgi:exodeoxyribonuclease VII large subunit